MGWQSRPPGAPTICGGNELPLFAGSGRGAGADLIELAPNIAAAGDVKATVGPIEVLSNCCWLLNTAWTFLKQTTTTTAPLSTPPSPAPGGTIAVTSCTIRPVPDSRTKGYCSNTSRWMQNETALLRAEVDDEPGGGWPSVPSATSPWKSLVDAHSDPSVSSTPDVVV